MVLHNDKWKKKATKLNNKKHGVSNYKGKNAHGAVPTLELDDHPEAVRRRQLLEAAMNPAAPEAPVAQDAQTLSGEEASEFDFSENGDLTSGDELEDNGNVHASQQLHKPARDAASRLTTTNVTNQSKDATVKPAAPGALAASPESDGTGGFARRKLVDNSWRYEDEYFDPHLQQPEVLDDFTGLEARAFELNDVERVPDERPTHSGSAVKSMDDPEAFESLRKAQQQEEIARHLKARYGVRKGYERPAASAIDEDAFFNTLSLHKTQATQSSCNESAVQGGESKRVIAMRTDDAAIQERSERDEKLEAYLDDLLGL